tara:strand:- start:459 stop:1448 length:990 start_codon:yes stop_codon:yes gene_type:complete
MKIFIIGSNSFMGSSLINYIYKNKYDLKLKGCSRSKENGHYFNLYKKNKKTNFKFYKIDLNKNVDYLIGILKKFKPNIIFNFAAQSIVEYSWVEPTHWFQTNLISNIKLLEYLKNTDFLDRYIYSSTPEVYGSTNKKIIENEFYNPNTPYATSKASIDMLLKNYHENYKLPVVKTRVSNIFGPGQQIYKLIPKTIISILKKKKIPIHGSGLTKRSFIYNDDVSSAMIKILKKGILGETYHITNEKMYSINSVIKIICKSMNVEYEKNILYVKDRPGKDQIYDLSSNKLKNKLKWKHKFSLEKGILSTKEWIINNYKFLNNKKLFYIHKK